MTGSDAVSKKYVCVFSCDAFMPMPEVMTMHGSIGYTFVCVCVFAPMVQTPMQGVLISFVVSAFAAQSP